MMASLHWKDKGTSDTNDGPFSCCMDASAIHTPIHPVPGPAHQINLMAQVLCMCLCCAPSQLQHLALVLGTM